MLISTVEKINQGGDRECYGGVVIVNRMVREGSIKKMAVNKRGMNHAGILGLRKPGSRNSI